MERASKERGRKMQRKKKLEAVKKRRKRATEGCRTEGCSWKTQKKRRKRETEGEVEGWEVDRQITTKLRLADSCESRIWYCGTDTQTQTCTQAHMQTQTGICVYTHAQAHRGTYTCSHYPKEPHYTWNINGAKQSAKMEMGETEGRREGETERGKVRKRYGWKQYVSITSPRVTCGLSAKWYAFWIITFTRSKINPQKQLIFTLVMLYLFHRANKARSSRLLKCPNADQLWQR